MTTSRTLRGFTLLELAVVMATIGMVVGILPMASSTVESMKRGSTSKKLDAIENALMAYRTAYNRLPCPADPAVASTSGSYGNESGSPGVCTGGTATQLDATHNIVEGAVPVNTLGLPKEFMYDAWGHKITYAVNQNVTSTPAMSGEGLSDQCGITVTDAGGGNRTTGAVYVLVSYGQDGHGSYDQNGNRINAGSTNGGEQTNCHCGANAVETTYAASYVQKNHTENSASSTDLFDDQVRFKERWQMMTPDDMYQTGGPVCQSGFIVPGSVAGQDMGSSVVFADINGDGYDDMIFANTNTTWGIPAQVYVLFGGPSGFTTPFLTSSLNGSNGFTITGMVPNGGVISVAAGDVNKDGIADIVIGVSNTGSQLVYVVFGHTGAWASSFNVNTINGTNGSVLSFPGQVSGSGLSVAVGDINHDGYKDLIVGDVDSGVNNPYNGLAGAGAVYVIYGQATPWPGTYASPFSYASINGTNGFSINGAIASAYLGAYLAAGDINGDGIDDLVLVFSASGGFHDAYVILGHSGAWANPFDPTTLDGSNGFTITKLYGNFAYNPSLAFADINGDGIPDLAMGEEQWDSFGNAYGRVSVLFGKRLGGSWSGSNGNWPASYDATAWPANCCTQFLGTTTKNFVGTSVASAKDFNGDGYEDLVIAAPSASPGGVSGAGSVYVVFGQPSSYSWPSTVNLSSLNGSTGVQFNGVVAGVTCPILQSQPCSLGNGLQEFMPGVAAGYLTGKTASTIYLSSYFQSYGGNAKAGVGYVLYGKKKTWSTPVSLLSLCPVAGCQ
jgi:type II secretory pathway pseudopilin PulG